MSSLAFSAAIRTLRKRSESNWAERVDRKHIFMVAPPAPKCFDSRGQWAEFLTSAQAAGKVKPFKDGQYRPEFGFCADCSSAHAAEMTRQGRCQAVAYQRSLQVAAVVVEVEVSQ